MQYQLSEVQSDPWNQQKLNNLTHSKSNDTNLSDNLKNISHYQNSNKKSNIKPKSISKPNKPSDNDDLTKKKEKSVINTNYSNPNSKYNTRGNIDRIHIENGENSEPESPKQDKDNINDNNQIDQDEDDKESVKSNSIRFKKDDDIVKQFMDNDLKSAYLKLPQSSYSISKKQYECKRVEKGKKYSKVFKLNDQANDTECRLHIIKDYYGKIWSSFNKTDEDYKNLIIYLANKYKDILSDYDKYVDCINTTIDEVKTQLDDEKEIKIDIDNESKDKNNDKDDGHDGDDGNL